MLCSFFVQTLQYLKRNAHEKWNTQIDFFSLLPWAAQMAKTEEFMFQMWLIHQLYVYKTEAAAHFGRRICSSKVVYLKAYLVWPNS